MTAKTIKLGSQFRRGQLSVRAADAAADPNTVELSFSDDTVVPQFFGNERLLHGAANVRLERLNAGAPFLFNHNANDPIGVVVPGSARISGGRGVATVQFFSTARAQEMRSMSEQGLRNTSTKYDIHAAREMADGDGFDITDWEPSEISMVTIPASTRVGIGRAKDEDEHEIPIGPAIQASTVRGVDKPAATAAITTGVTSMDGATNAAGDTTNAAAQQQQQQSQPQIGALEAERERRQAIINLCKANAIDSRVQEQWIARGVPLPQIANEILTVMEERGKKDPISGSAVGLTERETKRYSLFRAIRALRFGGQNPELLQEAAFEIECSRALAKQLGRAKSTTILVPGEVLQRPLGEAAQRALSVIPGSKGGYMVATEQMGFIDILRNRSVAMRMGARVISGLVGNLAFPRQTGKPAVTWQAGENVSATPADQTLGQLSMTPKTCIARTDISEQLLQQASPSAESFVMADLAANVAIDGVDAAAISGTGGAQPLGIKNTTGITSGQDAASATYAKVLAFVSTAGASNAILGNPGFGTNTAGAAKLMQVQRFSNTDTPLWTGNMLDGNLVGFNAMSSEQFSSGDLVFGSWDTMIIGEWGVLELATDSGGTRFDSYTLGVRAVWLIDILLRYPQAWVVGSNLS